MGCAKKGGYRKGAAATGLGEKNKPPLGGEKKGQKRKKKKTPIPTGGRGVGQRKKNMTKSYPKRWLEMSKQEKKMIQIFTHPRPPEPLINVWGSESREDKRRILSPGIGGCGSVGILGDIRPEWKNSASMMIRALNS